MVPDAVVYNDYRKLLEDKNIDAVVIATPLDRHYQMAMDALDAGKDVFCEKAMCYELSQCHDVYMKYKSGKNIFFVGQQRLFDPRYIQVMKLVHDGTFGDINAVWAYWNRNNDWRRPCPSADLDEHVNWRLYKAHSKGIMTELACHQLQIGTWAMRELPNKVMGHGAITHWKERREVYDNVSCVYVFDSGRKMTYDSVLSNKFYGYEEKDAKYTKIEEFFKLLNNFANEVEKNLPKEETKKVYVRKFQVGTKVDLMNQVLSEMKNRMPVLKK
jgi:predicted dehydrogenase